MAERILLSPLLLSPLGCCSRHHKTLHARSYSYMVISLLKDGFSIRKAPKLSLIPLPSKKDPLVSSCLGPQFRK